MHLPSSRVPATSHSTRHTRSSHTLVTHHSTIHLPSSHILATPHSTTYVSSSHTSVTGAHPPSFHTLARMLSFDTLETPVMTPEEIFLFNDIISLMSQCQLSICSWIGLRIFSRNFKVRSVGDWTALKLPFSRGGKNHTAQLLVAHACQDHPWLMQTVHTMFRQQPVPKSRVYR